MWIVRLALNRPYTFVVLALLLFLAGPVMLLRTPVDIFPEINIPVVSIIWTFTGLVPSEMETRVTSIYERALTTTVANVEHIESQSLNGVSVIKVYLHLHSLVHHDFPAFVERIGRDDQHPDAWRSSAGGGGARR